MSTRKPWRTWLWTRATVRGTHVNPLACPPPSQTPRPSWRLHIGATGGTTPAPWTAGTTAGTLSTQSSPKTQRTSSPSAHVYLSSRSSPGPRRRLPRYCAKWPRVGAPKEDQHLCSPRRPWGGCPLCSAGLWSASPERRSGWASFTVAAHASRCRAPWDLCWAGPWPTTASLLRSRLYPCTAWAQGSCWGRGSPHAAVSPSPWDASSAGWWTHAYLCASTSTRLYAWRRAWRLWWRR